LAINDLRRETGRKMSDFSSNCGSWANITDDPEVTANKASGRSAGRSEEQSEGGVSDSELAAFVAAWPKLPKHVRQTIAAIVASVGAG
jgi:hypothetical protein